LSARLSGLRPSRRVPTRGVNAAAANDPRQRVVVTVFYQAHGGGAGGKLIAHGKYLERDGAGAEGEPGQFYDRVSDNADAHPRLGEWADEEKRIPSKGDVNDLDDWSEEEI
jgi:hypothetical protein